MSRQEDFLMNLVTPSNSTSAVASGNWSNPATWQGGVVPTSGNITIPSGITVNLDAVIPYTYAYIFVNDGTFNVLPDVPTALTCDTMIATECATLQFGTDASPVTASCTITFAGGPINTTADPYQLTRGLVSMAGMGMQVGECGYNSIVGAYKTPYGFIQGAVAGATSLAILDADGQPLSPAGWQAGDELLLVSSGDAVVDKSNGDEIALVAGVSGSVVTLQSALKYNHTVSTIVPGLLIAVGNLTRNVVFQSASYSPILARGHVMFMMTAAVTARNAAFLGLGRTDKSKPLNDPQFNPTTWAQIAGTGTNPRARYSFHFHVAGTEIGAREGDVTGCVVVDSPGWGFDLHGSRGTFDSNIAYLCYGAGFVAERGDEVGTWTNNLGLRSTSTQQLQLEADRSTANFGYNGTGFWFQGVGGITVRNNYAAGHTNTQYGAGFTLYPFGLLPTDPDTGVLSTVQQTYPTCNLVDASIAQGADTMTVTDVPVRNFFGNVGYNNYRGSNIESQSLPPIFKGTTFNLGALDSNTFWRNRRGMGVFYTFGVTLQNNVIVDSAEVGIDANDEGLWHLYCYNNTVFNNKVGFIGDTFGGLEAFLTNTFDNPLNFEVEFVQDLNDPALTLNISNQTLGNTYSQTDVEMVWSETYLEQLLKGAMQGDGLAFLFSPHVVTLDGQQVYWAQQDGNYILFPSANVSIYEGTYHVPAALIGITNAQMWANYGICLNGGLAPSGYTTSPRIQGLLGKLSTYSYDARTYGVSYAEMFPKATGAYTLNVRNLVTGGQILYSEAVTVNPGWNMYTVTLPNGGPKRSYFIFGPV